MIIIIIHLADFICFFFPQASFVICFWIFTLRIPISFRSHTNHNSRIAK